MPTLPPLDLEHWRQSGILSVPDQTTSQPYVSAVSFFQAMLPFGKVTDFRVVMLAVNAYVNAERQADGVAVLEKLLEVHGAGMSAELKAVYFAALSILRATLAERIPLNNRIKWVRDTFGILEAASKLSADKNPLVHWASGIIYAQVPWFFFKKKEAYAHLEWLDQRPESEPVFGLYREVYRQLALLHRKDGRKAKADYYLAKAGYDQYEPKALFMGWFTATDQGTSMSPTPVCDEIVPGRVFALYGFGFSDIYFITSQNGGELIAIDAGTTPQGLKAAHEFLKARNADLPPLTTVFVTHAHWDHIGGHQYFKSLSPAVKFYGQANYRSVVERVTRDHSYKKFRGVDFDHQWVGSYAPDIEVTEDMRVAVGGTDFNLIPVVGTETEDAMLIHIPELSTVFVGDCFMPWYGEPWVNEGAPKELSSIAERVAALQADTLLHGHHPLTMMYSNSVIPVFSAAFAWLIDTVEGLVRSGHSVIDIQRRNLIPAMLVDHPDAYLPYLAARDNAIARIVDQMVGIWREDATGQEPMGLDALTSDDLGRALSEHFGLSATAVEKAIGGMVAAGDHETALRFAVAAERQFGKRSELTSLKETAADHLRSAAQFLDPFRFVTYTEMIGIDHKPLPADQEGTVK